MTSKGTDMINDTLSSEVAVSLRQRAALVDPAAADRIVARVATARPQAGRGFAVAGSAAGVAGGRSRDRGGDIVRRHPGLRRLDTKPIDCGVVG